MPILIYYSRAIAIFCVWAFVIYPSLVSKINFKKDPISYTVFDKRYGHFFNLGLLTTSVFQLLFIFRLLTDFNLTGFSLGLILYTFSLICLFIAGIITERESHTVHAILAKLYIVFTLLG